MWESRRSLTLCFLAMMLCVWSVKPNGFCVWLSVNVKIHEHSFTLLLRRQGVEPQPERRCRSAFNAVYKMTIEGQRWQAEFYLKPNKSKIHLDQKK